MASKSISYIQMMQNQRGQDWLITLTPEQIQNNAKRIVKDIARGWIEYDKFGYVFFDLKFTENLIIAIRNELDINTLNLVSCRFYHQYYPTNRMAPHIVHLEAVERIYNTILMKLNELKMTGNIGCMVDTPGLLFNDKNHLNTL